MIIYESYENGEITELTAQGHIDPHEFLNAVKEQTGIDVNLGDVKQIYQRMYFKRNRNPTKAGYSFYKKCGPEEFGAMPVTIARVEI